MLDKISDALAPNRGTVVSSLSENVLPFIAEARAQRERCALVTLVGIDGNAPRPLGAQMAVREDGAWCGYLSGGCLESAIALEAVSVIKSGLPKLIRYGKGSPFLDIRLPCGSGLDIYVQPAPADAILDEALALTAQRKPFMLEIGLPDGEIAIRAFAPGDVTGMWGECFLKVYLPDVTCLIIGSTPIAAALANLANAAGLRAVLHRAEAPDEVSPGVVLRELPARGGFEVDPWTAVIFAFHDHEQELEYLPTLLKAPCFYAAAIGSRSAHEARRLALAAAGIDEAAIARLKSPAGLVGGLKAAPLVAVSILAEVVAAAKSARIVE